MSLARNVATVGSATLVSRILGFLRDVGVAALLGAGPLADAYLAALQLPNLFRRLLADGALNAAFVPMWLRKAETEGPAGARRFGGEALGVTLLGLAALAILAGIFAPQLVGLLAPGFDPGGERAGLAALYVRLSIGYVAIAGAVAVWASVLNAHSRVAAVAVSVVAFNCIALVAVAALIISGASATERTGAILSGAFVLAGVGQLAIVGIALRSLPQAPLRLRFRVSADVRRFFLLAFPGVIAAGIPQFKLMAGAIVASSSQGAVSWLYYANRLYELPLGLASIVTASVLVPLIAASRRRENAADLAAAQSRAFEIVLTMALPAAVALAILAGPIVSVLFERGAFGAPDSLAVAGALAAMAAGLPGHALEKVFGAVSFAHEDTRTPMTAALLGLATAIVGAIALFPLHGHLGVAAAIAISGWVGAVYLAVVLGRRGWLGLDAQARQRLPRIVLATVVMGIAIILMRQTLMLANVSMLWRVATLAFLIAFGLAIYLLLLQVFGVARWRQLLASMR